VHRYQRRIMDTLNTGATTAAITTKQTPSSHACAHTPSRTIACQGAFSSCLPRRVFSSPLALVSRARARAWAPGERDKQAVGQRQIPIRLFPSPIFQCPASYSTQGSWPNSHQADTTHNTARSQPMRSSCVHALPPALPLPTSAATFPLPATRSRLSACCRRPSVRNLFSSNFA